MTTRDALLWAINVFEIFGSTAGIVSAVVLWKVYHDRRFRALHAALTRKNQDDRRQEDAAAIHGGHEAG